jgi:hypothetical protein
MACHTNLGRSRHHSNSVHPSSVYPCTIQVSIGEISLPRPRTGLLLCVGKLVGNSGFFAIIHSRTPTEAGYRQPARALNSRSSLDPPDSEQCTVLPQRTGRQREASNTASAVPRKCAAAPTWRQDTSTPLSSLPHRWPRRCRVSCRVSLPHRSCCESPCASANVVRRSQAASVARPLELETAPCCRWPELPGHRAVVH